MRIAVLHHGTSSSTALSQLRCALSSHGLAEGHSYSLVEAGATGRWDTLPALAQLLINDAPDLLVAIGGHAALAAQRATTAVPIFFAIVLDPAAVGLVGANITGVSTFDASQAGRHLRLLKAILPGLASVACLSDSGAPTGPDGRNPLLAAFLQAGATEQISIVCADLAGGEPDTDALLAGFERARVQAVVALEVPAVLAQLSTVAEALEAHCLPTVFPFGAACQGLITEGTALCDAIEPLATQIAAFVGGTPIPDIRQMVVHRDRLLIHSSLASRIGQVISPVLMKLADPRVELARRPVMMRTAGQ